MSEGGSRKRAPATTASDVPDRYPTRRSASPATARRRDPVVHGSGHGPLDAGQLAAFETDGFVVIDRLLTAREVGALQREVEHLAGQGHFGKIAIRMG